jgi:hypothetical protein
MIGPIEFATVGIPFFGFKRSGWIAAAECCFASLATATSTGRSTCVLIGTETGPRIGLQEETLIPTSL